MVDHMLMNHLFVMSAAVIAFAGFLGLTGIVLDENEATKTASRFFLYFAGFVAAAGMWRMGTVQFASLDLHGMNILVRIVGAAFCTAVAAIYLAAFGACVAAFGQLTFFDEQPHFTL